MKSCSSELHNLITCYVEKVYFVFNAPKMLAVRPQLFALTKTSSKGWLRIVRFLCAISINYPRNISLEMLMSWFYP